MEAANEATGVARRPITQRSSRWAVALSARLARSSVTPNQISVMSVAFAAAGAALILVAAGYAAGIAWLGWLAALLAVTTAYVRLLGGSLAVPQDFGGVMAKQHRMAVLTGALVLQAVEHS